MKGLISPPQGALAAQRREREHILVVHPDEELREELRVQLKSAGYDVTVAEDAVVAGHRVVEHAPDLIVAAADMPYMDGIEFAAALRGDETLPEIPVILVCAPPAGANVTRLQLPLLTTPVLRDQLLAAVAQGLELRARAGQSSPPRS